MVDVTDGRRGRVRTGHGCPSPRRAARLTDEQKEFSKAHLRLCAIVARKMSRKCPAVSLEDFYQASFVGLADAIKGFDEAAGVKFESYADRRMVGECLDMMRAEGPIRVTRKGQAELKAAGEMLRCFSLDDDRRSSDGRAARSDWRAKDLIPDDTPAPDAGAESGDNFDAWLRGLDRDEQYIVREYVVNGKTMKQIGFDLDLSESRVSQKYMAIIARLRERAQDPRYRMLADYRQLATA